MTKVIPNTATRTMNMTETSARVHPNSFWIGKTKILHAYTAPRARFIESPPTMRHHRFNPSSPPLTPHPGARCPAAVRARRLLAQVEQPGGGGLGDEPAYVQRALPRDPSGDAVK